MKRKITTGWVLALAMVVVCGCGPVATPFPATVTATSTLRSGTLQPYQTRTATPALILPEPATPTQEPTATPTPRTHVVKAGEDMSGIALRFRVKLSELKTANPSVIPNAMKIGAVLLIPGTETIPTAPATAATFTATPSAIRLEKPGCSLDSQGGATCFAMVHNQQGSALENVTAAIRLVDAQGKTIASQQVSTPLNLLAPGSAQPVMAYFPPPLQAGFQAVSILVSALPASEGGKRYLAVRLENQQTNILNDGLAAEVAGEVTSQADQAAGQVWVAAVAYDSSGSVVGLRRWEAAAALPAGGRLPFALNVYSVGGTITKVDLLVEAQP